jgi:ribosomal protein S5
LCLFKNVTSKILGTNNKVNNAKCTVLALSKLKKVTVKEVSPEKKDKPEVKETLVNNKKA